MSEQNDLSFDLKNWKIKTEIRSKNRMKFTIKLDQQESAGFQEFAAAVKPDEVPLDDFVRSLFFHGIRTLEQQLTQQMVEHMEANREEFEASGFSFDEDGKLTGTQPGMEEVEVEEEGDIEVVE